MVADYTVAVDWNDDDDFSGTGEDVTSRTLDNRTPVSIRYGRDQERALSPMGVGEARFELDNRSRDYSPENGSSPLVGLVQPGRAVRIDAEIPGDYDGFGGTVSNGWGLTDGGRSWLLPTGAIVAPDWGLASPLTPGTSADAYSRGFRTMFLEMTWASAETADNTFSSSYFTSKRSQAATWRAEGHKVVLNFGLHHAPSWLFSGVSDMRFIRQDGVSSSTLSTNDMPNFVFNTAARDLYGQRYVNRVIQELGTDFYVIRIGGGHFGELNYPDDSGWWAFDTNAQAQKPAYGVDPAWLPGVASTNHDKARAFWDFYITKLMEYQNWQIAALRSAGFTGTIACLQASDGTRSDPAAPGYTSGKDPETAIATDLNGSTGIELNEMREGYDHKKMVMGISADAGDIAIWATGVQRDTQVPEVAYWANARGYRKMAGENADNGSYEEAAAVHRNALTYGMEHILWIRGEQAYGSTGATEDATSMTAGIDALQQLISAGINPVHVIDDWRTFKTVSPWNPWRSNQWTVSGTAHTVETQTAGGVMTWTDTSGAVARAIAKCGWTNNASAPMANVADCELLTRFQFSSTGTLARLELHLRGSGDWGTSAVPTNAYWLEIATNSSTVTVKKSISNTVSTIATYTMSSGVTTAMQWVRFQVQGSTIRARHWTSTEPATWDYEASGVASEVASGVGQIRWLRSSTNSGVKSVTFDSYRLMQLAAAPAASDYSESGGLARISLGSVDTPRVASLQLSLPAITVAARFQTSAAATGASINAYLSARRLDAQNQYLARLAFQTNGILAVSIGRYLAGVFSNVTPLTSTGIAYQPNVNYWLKFTIAGTVLRAKTWKATDAEPYSWNVEGSDTGLAAANSSVGIRAMLSAGNTNTLPVTVSVGEFSASLPSALFRGYLDDFDILPDINARSVPVSCVDALTRLRQVKVSTSLYRGKRTGELVNVVLDEAEWPSDLRDIDAGATVAPWWWEEDTDAYEAITKLVASEGPGAFLTVDTDGRVVFRDRHHRLTRLPSLTSQATWRGSGTEPVLSPPMAYRHGWSDIVNSVTFTVPRYSVAGNWGEVWSQDGIISIPAGRTVSVVASASNPFMSALTPVEGTDYTVLSGAVTVVLSRTSGQSATIFLTASLDTQITDLRLRALSVTTPSSVRVSAKDTASISSSKGVRTLASGQEPVWAGVHDAAAIARLIVGQRSDRLPTVVVTMGGNDTRLAEQLTRDLSDRVHIVESETGLDDDFFVETIQQTITEGGLSHVTQFGCEKVPTQVTPIFRFNTAGAGFSDGKFGRIGLDDPATMFRFGVAGRGFSQGLFAN